MVKKKKTLPKNFKELIEKGNFEALKAVFDDCELDARGGFDKETALHFYNVPDDLVRWLVEQGLDINTPTNTYRRTPLSEHARVGSGTVDLLLELGADIEASEYDGDTPLHIAAGFSRADTVRTLIAHGANIHAKNRSGLTPLGKSLAQCRNADISWAAEVAAILLDAGAEVTPRMKEDILRIGKEFEFHRESFNKDLLAETDAGLTRLYELFGVERVAMRRTHDGVSPIVVDSANWQRAYSELWDYLVPSQGAAKTVQGEVIRITGRVSHEISDNGGANWDADFRKMLDALVKHLGSGAPLERDELTEATRLAADLRSGSHDDGLPRLAELSVRWVSNNPTPIPLGKVDYKR